MGYDDDICPNCGAGISEVAEEDEGLSEETDIVRESRDNRLKTKEKVSNLCSNCAATLDDDAKFCSSCRAPVALEGVISCPSCKKLISARSQFCKYCADELTSNKTSYHKAQQNIPQYTQPRPQGTAARDFIVAGAIIAAVSAFAYLWGVNYAGNFTNMMSAGFSNMLGRKDPTYDLAILAVNLGRLGFFAGLIISIVGLALKNK